MKAFQGDEARSSFAPTGAREGRRMNSGFYGEARFPSHTQDILEADTIMFGSPYDHE